MFAGLWSSFTSGVGGHHNMLGGRWNEDDDPEDIYELIRLLDRGESGEVWLAKEKSSGEEVAIKMIDLDPDLQEELAVEIGALSKCSSEYIIKYHESFRKEDSIWIVMECADVGSLEDLLQHCLRALKEDEIRAVCASVISGLDYLHGLGIIHRDIKAKNILVNSKGRIKLADLGVAGFLDKTRNKRRTAIGSPHWMAPEVIVENEYDGRADVWSLGITVLELAEMEPPYADVPIHDVLLAIPRIDPPTFAEPSLWGEELKSFVAECLQKDHGKRKTAKELLNHPFIAEEVKRQESGVFSTLENMVQEYTRRMVWMNEPGVEFTEEDLDMIPGREFSSPDLAISESEEGFPEEDASVSSRSSLLKRLSQNFSKTLRHTSRKSRKQSRAVPTSTDTEPSSSFKDAVRKNTRKSKKVALLNSQPPSRKSRHQSSFGMTQSTGSTGAQSLETGAKSTLEERKSTAGESDLSDHTSPEEAKERDRKAEEIKQRLFKLYNKFERKGDDGAPPVRIFDNFGK